MINIFDTQLDSLLGDCYSISYQNLVENKRVSLEKVKQDQIG